MNYMHLTYKNDLILPFHDLLLPKSNSCRISVDRSFTKKENFSKSPQVNTSIHYYNSFLFLTSQHFSTTCREYSKEKQPWLSGFCTGFACHMYSHCMPSQYLFSRSFT